jgi:flagellar hook-basal body complex protein FliE
MSIPSITPAAIQKTGLSELGRLNQSNQTQGAAGAFGSTLTNALNDLSHMQVTADQSIQKLAAGENVDLHQVMIAAEETDVSFRVAMAMRDKLVEAYQEVMRMQV